MCNTQNHPSIQRARQWDQAALHEVALCLAATGANTENSGLASAALYKTVSTVEPIAIGSNGPPATGSPMTNGENGSAESGGENELYKTSADCIKSACPSSELPVSCESVATDIEDTMPVATTANPSQHGRRREALAESLTHDILRGQLQAGEHLVLRELSTRFGVSATPLREALITLAGLGLVDLLPNRGAVVRQMSAEQVHDLLQVRRALECEATRSACGRIRRSELLTLDAELRTVIAAGSGAGDRWVDTARNLDSRLHDLIAASCRNLFLAKELERFKMLFRAFRDVAWQREQARHDYRRLHEEAVEHLTIVQALLAGDGKEAARAMARHIRGAAKYWRRVAPVAR
jgi:DNA-binding GntR family transcriptional regulator